MYPLEILYYCKVQFAYMREPRWICVTNMPARNVAER